MSGLIGRLGVLLCLGALGVGAGSTFAAEGRIPIYQPTLINDPGSYYVTQNIAGTGAVPVIDVQSSGVDIDLNGFTLSQAAGLMPVVRVGRVERFRIHGGGLLGGYRSIDWVPDAGHSQTIEDITMTSPAQEGIHIAFGSGHIIRRVNIVASGGDGIWANVVGNTSIEDCAMHGPMGTGVHILNGVGVRIVRCGIRAGGAHGIWLQGTDGSINIGVQMRDNLVLGALDDGYRIEDIIGGEIWDNYATRCVGSGIHLLSTASSISVRNNHIDGSSVGDGIRVDGAMNSIEGNHLATNHNYGLHFSATAAWNMYGGNAMSQNSAAVACGVAAVLNDFCNEGTNIGSFGTNLVPTQPLF